MICNEGDDFEDGDCICVNTSWKYKEIGGCDFEKYGVTVINGIKDHDFDLSEFDRIGFATGIAFGKFYPQMLKIMDEKLPEGKAVFSFTHMVLKKNLLSCSTQNC